MPFNRQALEKLLELDNVTKRQLSLRQLALRLNKFCKNSFLGVSSKEINEWLNGKNYPNADHIDLLYKYSRSSGYKNLEFYISPED